MNVQSSEAGTPSACFINSKKQDFIAKAKEQQEVRSGKKRGWQEGV